MSFFVFVPVFAATVSVVLGVRSAAGGRFGWNRALALMFGATAFWSIGYAGEILHPGLNGKLWWDNLQFIGYSLVAPGSLLFTLLFLDYPLGRRKRLWLFLALEPIATNILVWIDRYEHLIRIDPHLVHFGGHEFLEYTWGPWFVVSTAIALAISFLSLALLAFRAATVSVRYRRRMVILFIGMAIPWLGGFLSTIGLASPWVRHLDVSPLFFTIGFSVIMWASRSGGFFSVTPRTYRRVVEEMPDGLLVIAKDGTVLDANPAAVAMFDGDDSRVGTMPADALLPRPIIEEVLRSDYAPRSATVAVPARHTLRHFSIRTIPLTDSRKRRTGQLVLSRDITEEVHSRQEHERLKREVDSIVHHDIRSPVNGIIGAVELLRAENAVPSEYLEMLKAIEESANKVLATLDQTLTIFRIEEGKFDYIPEPIDPASIVSACITDLSGIARYRRVEIDTAIDLPDGTPPAAGDETLAYTIIANLLRNAIEASPEGGCVSVSLGTTAEWYTIAIRNEGVVPLKIRDIFFEKYATAGKKGGTGFGTYIAKMFSEAQGWKISMETSSASGTTLTLQIPVYPTDAGNR
ncbi:MAG: histidine kinase N-terminal 7TM domain-containing protein [Alkalispirochaeta sp.]